MQVLKLTDEQIEATYNHFENGDEAPEGVELHPKGFTHTMGRVYDSESGFITL